MAQRICTVLSLERGLKRCMLTPASRASIEGLANFVVVPIEQAPARCCMLLNTLATL
jgi:hypothetical protein